MGQIPPAKMFSNPTPFGSSPIPNTLTQTQNAVQIPTAGVGFANTNQGDSQITQNAPAAQSPSQPDAGGILNPFLQRYRFNDGTNMVSRGMLQQ